MKYDINRRVGEEVSKNYKRWIKNGYLEKYFSGNLGLDIGFNGYLTNIVPILDTAVGIDINYNGYDGVHLPFDDNSVDYILASHMLEHVSTPLVVPVLREWLRVLKINSYMIITVPHKYLYEKKNNLPSRYNGDHKRFYTPSTLLKEIEDSFKPNTYRVELLQDNDLDFNYNIPPEKHSSGSYEILLIIKKIKEPLWEIK